MRTRLTFFAALLSVTAIQPMHAQKAFEGRVVMEMRGDEKSSPLVMWIKGSKARMNMSHNGQEFGIIMDHGASQMTMLMSGPKMYMQQAIPNVEADGDGKAKMTRTGKTSTVAGHQCEIIRVEDPEAGTSEICGATDMGRFVMGQRSPAERSKTPAWAKGLENFFPLRVTDGEGTTVLEVTAIEEKPVDSALFAPPAGYKPMSMPGR
jgi:hypothetical protein